MPIFMAAVAAFTAISAWVGTLGVVGTALLQAAVGIGLNLLAQAIAGKPKDPTFAVNGTLQSGGDLPRTFIFGQTATAGSLVWCNTWGKSGDTPNAYLTQVIALSDYPVRSLDELWVNGEKVTIDRTNNSYSEGFPIKEYGKSDGNDLWVKFYDGTQTAADSFLTGRASNSQRRWESTRVGRGVAYAIVTSQVNHNKFSGIPTFKFVLSGAKLYDVSKDSTEGGVGSQRYGDPATWGGDGDLLPAVQAYNLLRGISYGGKWLFGLQGLAAARLPSANWIAQINKCRQPIAGAAGPEPTYRSSGEIAVDAPLSSALEAVLTSCQGRISEVGGVYSIYLGAPDTPSFTFTDGDILSSEEQSFTPFFGLADTINGISASYPSPKDGWNVKTAPPLYRTDLEAQHGNRRLMADVSLDLVPYAEQVQRLMKSALEEGQRARRHTLVLPPEYWAAAVPGAVCAWTSERNGYTTKLFRVDGAADRANLDVMIDITEVDPADYNWSTETDFKPPVEGEIGVIRPQPAPIIDWFAEGDIADGDEGRRRAVIKMSWDGSKANVAGIRFQVRKADTLEVVHTGSTDEFAAGSIKISQNIFSLTRYGVRGCYIMATNGQEGEWSDWLAVLTPDQPYTDVVLELRNIQKDFRDELQRRQQEFDEVFARLEFLAANAGSANIEDIVGRQVFQKQVGQTRAQLIKESGLRATADEALAYDLTQVGARVGTAEAGILQEATARANADNAISSILTAVSATADAGTAGGLMQWVATAAPGGVSARFRLEGKATSGGVSRFAGMYLDVLPTTSRLTFLADQFVITDGSANGLPFVYEGGVLKLALANIGTVTAGTIKSPDNKFVISLSSGSIEWFD